MIAEIDKESRENEIENLEDKVTGLIQNRKYWLAIEELILMLQIKEGIAIADQSSSKKLRKRITGEV